MAPRKKAATEPVGFEDDEHYEVGVALDLRRASAAEDLMEFLERARGREPGQGS